MIMKSKTKIEATWSDDWMFPREFRALQALRAPMTSTSLPFNLENVQLPKNKVCYDMKSEIVIILLRSALFGAAFIGFPPSLIELEAAPASSEGWESSINCAHDFIRLL